MTRQWADNEAKRERVPMLVGLVGPSGSGKTYSALRLATGMQKVTGGEVFYIDTESRRALHYADSFDFRHVPMDAPFSPLDYIEAIEYCVKRKAGVVIVDSMSHEHEGPGGVLEMHESELDRMAGNDFKKRDRMTFAAWAKPKAQRRKLINTVLRLGVNAVFCFRAKEKLRILPGKQPINRGWQPIAGEEFIYEMTISCLLYPGANGVPNWSPDESDERQMLKRPENLRSVFRDGEPLSEATGEGLAAWAGGDVPSVAAPEKPASESPPHWKTLMGEMSDAETIEELDAIGLRIKSMSHLGDDERGELRDVFTSLRRELSE